MLLKIFINFAKNIREEIIIKITDKINVHFKCRTAEKLLELIAEFGKLGILWKKCIVCKSHFYSGAEILRKLLPYRAAVDVSRVAEKLKGIKLGDVSNFFGYFNNISAVSLSDGEIERILEILNTEK